MCMKLVLGFLEKSNLVEPGFEMEQVSDWGVVTSSVKSTFNDTIITSATFDEEISHMYMYMYISHIYIS